MYAHTTLLEIDLLRVGIDEAVKLFESEVLPALRDLDGYRGVLVLANGEGRGVLLTLWDTAETAASEAAFYEMEIAKYLTLFRSPPGRESYSVMLADGVELPTG